MNVESKNLKDPMSNQVKAPKGIALTSILKALLRRWNEAPLALVALIIFVASPTLFRWIDPTAGVYDIGVLHRFMYAAAGTFAAHFTAWLMLQFSFPELFKYFYNVFEYDLLQSTSALSGEVKHKKLCLRLLYSFLVFALYLATFLLILATID